MAERQKTLVIQIRMDKEISEKLEEVVRVKFRGISKSQAIRWMIEDVWKEIKKDENIPQFG